MGIATMLDSQKRWELINQIEITEETSLNQGISTDFNGNSFRLTDCVLGVERNVATENPFTMLEYNLVFSDDTRLNYVGGSYGGMIGKFGNILIGGDPRYNNKQWYSPYMANGMVSFLRYKLDATVKSVYTYSDGKNYGVGTKIYLYGVRE